MFAMFPLIVILVALVALFILYNWVKFLEFSINWVDHLTAAPDWVNTNNFWAWVLGFFLLGFTIGFIRTIVLAIMRASLKRASLQVVRTRTTTPLILTSVTILLALMASAGFLTHVFFQQVAQHPDFTNWFDPTDWFMYVIVWFGAMSFLVDWDKKEQN